MGMKDWSLRSNTTAASNASATKKKKKKKSKRVPSSSTPQVEPPMQNRSDLIAELMTLMPPSKVLDLLELYGSADDQLGFDCLQSLKKSKQPLGTNASKQKAKPSKSKASPPAAA